jgi:hypothetical protein
VGDSRLSIAGKKVSEKAIAAMIPTPVNIPKCRTARLMGMILIRPAGIDGYSIAALGKAAGERGAQAGADSGYHCNRF